MRFTSLVLAIAASVTAQFPVAEEVLWPTNDWTVREAYSSVNDTKAEVGFSVTMYLPLNNTLEALHQTCGRSWDRKIIPTVPSDWATCEIDEKVAWRFQPGTEHDFPKTFTLQVLFWDRMDEDGATLVSKYAPLEFYGSTGRAIIGNHAQAVIAACATDRNTATTRCEYNSADQGAHPPYKLDVEALGEILPLANLTNVTTTIPSPELLSPNTANRCIIDFTLVDNSDTSFPGDGRQEYCEFIWECRNPTSHLLVKRHLQITCFGRQVTLDVEPWEMLEPEDDVVYPDVRLTVSVIDTRHSFWLPSHTLPNHADGHDTARVNVTLIGSVQPFWTVSQGDQWHCPLGVCVYEETRQAVVRLPKWEAETYKV